MKKKSIKILFAITGVIFGISLFLFICISITKVLGVTNIYELLSFMPTWVIIWVGVANVLTFFPIFISGIYFLKPQGAIGNSDHLIKGGIYKYLRNPFYSGVSFTLFGTGLIINSTGVSLAGLIWLVICFFQCKREEIELAKKFDNEYLLYKNNTPMFIPRFDHMIRDLIVT